MSIVLSAENLVKTFPGVRALDEATLTLTAGSVHALLGENGAGKSTLIKILTGVYRPDGGQLRLPGPDGELRTVQLGNPQDAQRAGIGVVHQERNLIPAFTVAREHLPATPAPARRPARPGGAARRGPSVPRCAGPRPGPRPAGVAAVGGPDAVGGDRQGVVGGLDGAAARRTDRFADHEEADRLYGIVRRLSERGHATVLVSHKLEEVFAVADTVTVLRDGRSVAEAEPLADHTRERDRRPDGRPGVPAGAPRRPRPSTADTEPALALDDVAHHRRPPRHQSRRTPR